MENHSITEHNHRIRPIDGITLERIFRALGNRLMNKTARLSWIRSWSSSGYVSKEGVSSDLFPEVDPEIVFNSLSQDGVWRGFKLPKSVLTRLCEFANNSPAYGNRNPCFGFYPKDLKGAQLKTGVNFTVASYYNTYEQCPEIRLIAQDPVLNEVALRHIGPRAKLLSTNMWWSYANYTKKADQNQYAQLFHYDLDDYKFMKFFFYLTDVDSGTGPHVYIKGTHKKKSIKHVYPMRRFQDDEINSTYLRESKLVLEGQAGDGFAEDTFGIHKGAVPVTKDRLILEIYYAISRGFTDFHDSSQLKMIEL